MNESLAAKRDQLLDFLTDLKSCAIAFSAGIDSTVVAKAAQLALGNQAIAVTGSSSSLASGELQEAERLAELIGIRHLVLETGEFTLNDYVRNAPDRCFHCKTELYSQIAAIRPDYQIEFIVNGANLDDLDDYRPGMRAAKDQSVLSPLAECQFNKEDIRQLAQHWQLPNWDKPASPCLSSRIAYGEEVTPERLEMIDRGENLLRSLDFAICRVRFHRGEIARIEVPREQIFQLLEHVQRGRLVEQFKQLGFRYVTVDLDGFRSGSLNQLVQIELGGSE